MGTKGCDDGEHGLQQAAWVSERPLPAPRPLWPSRPQTATDGPEHPGAWEPTPPGSGTWRHTPCPFRRLAVGTTDSGLPPTLVHRALSIREAESTFPRACPLLCPLMKVPGKRDPEPEGGRVPANPGSQERIFSQVVIGYTLESRLLTGVSTAALSPHMLGAPLRPFLRTSGGGGPLSFHGKH